ncbi:uncharacterized protein LOC111380658 [Olea europaea var. sylvestris]|uniref:uncharacterized protein LOC111380658 n=1 Tax=Olea europaea var. sylvestris TaxID=158386 RepID=UPI000C1D81B8|nr:uncharacterized protein LOC111380658 [Olea europaea var. sylvestris]
MVLSRKEPRTRSTKSWRIRYLLVHFGLLKERVERKLLRISFCSDGRRRELHSEFSKGAQIAPQQTVLPGFQQNEKKSSLEDLVTKLAKISTQHMQRTDKILQIQGVVFKNLENQMGQIAKALLEKQQGVLPSDTEINPKQQVMAVKVVENEEVGAITTRSGIQLLEITVERWVKATVPIKPYGLPVPFPQRLQKRKLEEQFAKFLDIFRKLHVNIPLIEALSQIPNYAKILKEILSKKRRLIDFETIKLNEECGDILQNKLPPKQQDPESLKISYSIGNDSNFNCLCDLGANIEEPWDATLLILGRSFLSTSRAVIDFESGELTLRVEDKQQKFKIYNTIEYPL